MGGIDLDPASSDIAQQTVKTTRYYTIVDDGLSHDWSGRVWLNPPYAKTLVELFTEKIARHIPWLPITSSRSHHNDGSTQQIHHITKRFHPRRQADRGTTNAVGGSHHCRSDISGWGACHS